ncbi:MAG: hypothetical protein AAGF12_18765 [Myxococcota bacterium]
MVRTAYFAAAAVSTLILLLTSDASACHNGIAFDVDAAVRRVSGAERMLERGRTGPALRAAGTTLDRMRRNRAARRHRGTATRAQQIIAIAVIRAEGRVDLQRHRVVPTITPLQRKRNIRWAVDLLDRLRRDRPALDARFAEGLGLLDERRAEGLRILRELSADDLLPDAWAYRALANLELAEGEASRAQSARDECRRRARNRANQICIAP